MEKSSLSKEILSFGQGKLRGEVIMKRKGFIFFFFIFLSSGIFLSAQLTQTGYINGKVTDEEGQPLPGVAVTIKSPALILPQMDMVTTASGTFRFPGLPPGLYTVTFQLTGFKTLVREGIRVSVGLTTTIDVTLEMSQIEETVTVVGQTPAVDIKTSTMVASLTSEFLQSVPASRNLSTFFNMAPGVTSSLAHGSSERDNTYNIDGVNVTDPVTGTQAGSFGIDIMEELSVQTGALPAEYGSVRGAVVNVVTKSGGNRFSGSASFYYRDKSLVGDNTKFTVFEGSESGFDYESEPVFTLGGPVIKDKIWFFGNFSFNKSQEFLPGYPWDETGAVPLDYYRIYPYIKATYQMTEKDRLILSFNFSDYKRHHRGASYNRTVESTWDQTTPIYTYNIQYTRMFGPNLFMNVKGAYMDYHLNLTAKNDLPRIYNTSLIKYRQSYGYDDVYTRRRLQLMADATYFIDDWFGRHEIKGGIEFERSSDSRYRGHNMTGTVFNLDVESILGYPVGPFFYYRNVTVGDVTYEVPNYVTYYQDFTRLDKKIVIGGFLQDTWSPIDRLTVNLGLRFDHQDGIIPKQGLERGEVEYGGEIYDPRVLESFTAMTWNTLAPRLGLTFDITGDGKTAFKMSFGRYYIANIMQWFVTVNPNSFISWRHYFTYSIDLATETMTVTGVEPMSRFSATASATMDPDLKSPYLDEFTIGIERELARNISLGVRYIRKWDRNLIEDVDLNAFDLDAYKTDDKDILDPSLWLNYYPVTAVDPYDGSTVTFWEVTDLDIPGLTYVTNPPGAERDYDGVEVVFNKRFSNRWSLSASYVYQKSRGLIGTDFDDSWSGEAYFDSPNAHINALGNFTGERRHQVKIQFMWRAPLGIDVSGYYRYLDGSRFTRRIRSDDLGLDLSSNFTIYAETRGSRKLPGLHYFDARVEKVFKLPKKFGQFSVFADVFNVLNINTMTGVQSLSSTTQTVNGHPVSFLGQTGIPDPLTVRLGAKFEF